MRMRTLLPLLLLGLSLGADSAADDDAACPHAAVDIAPRIKAVLHPHYVAPDDLPALQTSFRELEVLLLEIGHCRAVAQSIESPGVDRQAQVVEWHSLNQWLYRLVNFVGLNSRGDASVDWRDEYSLFAEVYEFEP